MGFAEEEFRKYLNPHLVDMQHIRVDELLVPLSACLTPATVERLNAHVRNQGNRSTVLDFYLDLSRCDDWVNHLINALEYCGHQELATKFLQEYSKHRLTLSSPRSLPPTSSNHNQQPPQENPQGACSLPEPMPPSPQNTQPGPSPKPMQPEREMSPNSASRHNHEFRSLPPLPYDPPSPPRATLAQSVSKPIQSDRRTSEDKMSRTKVPETSPHPAAPCEGDIWAFQTASNYTEQPVSPNTTHSIRETIASGEYHDVQSANPEIPYGSSCRPLQNNNDETYFSKPGVLLSTPGFGDDTNEDGELSESSRYVLEISDCTERSESSNSSHQCSPTSSTQRKSPPVSTPNNRSMEITDRGSPEENDFTFDRAITSNSYKSSPGGNRRLDQSSSKQPEENSFGSRDVSHYQLDFNEGPEAELLEGNDDGLRNRQRKIPNPNKMDDRSTEETCSRGRDRERTVLITITILSVCLSLYLLYLLWKNQHN